MYIGIIIRKIMYTSYRAGVSCAAYERFMFAQDVFRATYLYYKILSHSIISSQNVYETIDNKKVRRNRLGQYYGTDIWLPIQLEVTAPIETPHNLFQTLKSDKPK